MRQLIFTRFSNAVRISIACLTLASGALAQEVRIKELANVRGVRSNQLMGIGLVVGLSKSGDSTASISTNKAAAAMLQKMGLKVTDQQISGGMAALVMVTAELPAFARNGDRLDVRVSTIGDAKSLAGGVLMSTALKANDGQVYGMAQGPVVVGQATGAGVQVQTVAIAPGAFTVEREFAPVLDRNGTITISLKRPDFTTNKRVVEVINRHFKGFYATSKDIHGIEIQIPEIFQDRTVDFIAELEALRVVVDQKAVVLINERTGTVVMGGDVVISPVTISHGDLSISVGSGGGSGKKKGNSLVNFGGTSVSKLVEGMNSMGMKPADLVGVMQALQSAGALQGELRFM
jgi:flagellar P-ring protein precursor FlgI